MLGYYFSNSKRDLCIALEYFPEGDLHTYLSGREALSESHTQEIISQVLQGLAIMHEAGFAHRDIKPQVSYYTQTWSYDPCRLGLTTGSIERPHPTTSEDRTRIVVGEAC